MIKFYILLVLTAIGLVVYGLDWFLESKNLNWQAMIIVWPFWVLTLIVGFLVGGLIMGFMAEFAFQRDIRKAEHDLFKNNEENRNQVEQQQREVNQLKLEAEEKMREATAIQEDTQRQIVEINLDIEKNRKSAFNATKTVERLRKKIKRLEERG